MDITFKKMDISDISQVLYWIRQDHVITYWFSAQNETDKTIQEKYIKRLNSKEVETYIIVLKNQPIGLIQSYFLNQDNSFHLSTSEKGIDLFIGDKEYIDKGIGTEVLKSFIKEKIFMESNVKVIGIDPEVANERAIHVYEKVGFRIQNIGYDSHSKLLSCYMILKIEDFFEN